MPEVMQIRVIDGDRSNTYLGVSKTRYQEAEAVATVLIEGCIVPFFLAVRNEDCIDALKRYLTDNEMHWKILGIWVKGNA